MSNLAMTPRARRWVPALVAMVVLTACGQRWEAGQGSPASPHPAPVVQAQVRTGGVRTGPPVVAGEAVWVANAADGTVSRIDPRTNRVAATLTVGSPQRLLAGGCVARSIERDSLLNRRCDVPSEIAAGGSSLWVADSSANRLLRIDADGNRVVETVSLGARPFGLAVDGDTVWVTTYFDGPASVLRVDARTGTVSAVVSDLPTSGCTGITAAVDAVWLSCSDSGTVARVDPATNRVAAVITVGQEPNAIRAGRGALWVHNEESSSVTRIDPASNQVVATVAAPAHVGRSGVDEMVLADDGLWISGVDLERLDLATNRLTRRLAVSGTGVDEGFGSLWVTSETGVVQRVTR